MKRIILLFSIVAALFMAGCTKDNEQQEPTGNDVRYYVRYEVSASSIHIGTMDVSVSTEKGTQSFQTSSKLFSETFGPVAKGFTAKVSATSNYGASFISSIYVCRGEEPFVLKATGTSSAEYVIDF